MGSSEMLENLIAKRIISLAKWTYSKMQQLSGRSYFVKWERVKEDTKIKYVRLAGFIYNNHLHPDLYLKTMKEFSVHFYPTVLYGQTALQKYSDYITKIKTRYKDVKTFNSANRDAMLPILRNDLWLVATCDPRYTPKMFFKDIPGGTFYGCHKLKENLDTFEDMIHPVTLKILNDLLSSGHVEQSKYAKLVRTATCLD
jgi:hypothetical protein